MTDTKDLTTILVRNPPSETELEAQRLLRIALGLASSQRLDMAAVYRIEKALEALSQ